MGKRIVVALGGNALGNSPEEQLKLVKGTARPIVDLVEKGCTRSAAGISSLGPQAQKCIPSLAQTTIRELATLLRASPKKVSLRPRTSPNSSFTVRIRP